MEVRLDRIFDFAVNPDRWMRADIGNLACAGCWAIPVVYQLVLFLESGGPLTPSNLAKIAGRSVQTVSGHLAKLRAADLVRCDTRMGSRFAIG